MRLAAYLHCHPILAWPRHASYERFEIPVRWFSMGWNGWRRLDEKESRTLEAMRLCKFGFPRGVGVLLCLRVLFTDDYDVANCVMREILRVY